MNPTFRSLLVLFAVAVTASAATEENFNRQIDAAAGDTLVLDVDFGSVDVSAGADGQVALEAHRKIDFGNESKEKAYLADRPITMTKEGNVVTIRARGSKKLNDWNIFHCTTEATYLVHVPKKFEVGLRTDGGMVVVREINGNVTAHTSGGRMAFARLEGTLDGETSGGAIEVEDCRGPIGVQTSGGHINVAGGQGSLKAHTSGGRIEVHNFSGDTEVRTSGGSLDLEKISGKVVGKTSGGGIRAWLPELLGDVKLETSAGSIELAVPTTAAFTIDAETSVGHVESRLPFQGLEANREHLRGSLNGGGKSVRLETSAGSITIKSTSEEVAHR